MELKSPMIALRPVKALYAVFMYVLVSLVCPVTKGPPPWVMITAQRNRARKVGGTMTAFTRNRIRSLWIGIHARIVWKIQ
jgi:hypothetical protein